MGVPARGPGNEDPHGLRASAHRLWEAPGDGALSADGNPLGGTPRPGVHRVDDPDRLYGPTRG